MKLLQIALFIILWHVSSFNSEPVTIGFGLGIGAVASYAGIYAGITGMEPVEVCLHHFYAFDALH